MKKHPLNDKIRQLKSALYSNDGKLPDLQQAVNSLSAVIDAAVFLIGREGAVLFAQAGSVILNDDLNQLVKDGSLAADQGLMQMLKNSYIADNEGHSDNREKGGHYYTLVPLTAGDMQSALLMFYSAQKQLNDDQLTLTELGALLIGLLQRLEKAGKEEEVSRNKKLAEGAFESLSYSEVEAIEEILKNITNNESVVTASKIADNLGITRSVIVNALRKFESAGIIESRSLGMKGTFIRVKNPHALEMIASRSFKSGSYR
jgi:transcriptional pleiotropic repressor